MDLNILHRAHQIEVLRADAAGDNFGRQWHLDKANVHAVQIGALRVAPENAFKSSVAAPSAFLAYKTYAWDPADDLNPSTDSRDNEGGAINSPAALQVPGKPLRLSSQYFVGDAVFSDLSSAVAEHARQAADLETASGTLQELEDFNSDQRRTM